MPRSRRAARPADRSAVLSDRLLIVTLSCRRSASALVQSVRNRAHRRFEVPDAIPPAHALSIPSKDGWDGS
jgi:hypothetical protein